MIEREDTPSRARLGRWLAGTLTLFAAASLAAQEPAPPAAEEPPPEPAHLLLELADAAEAWLELTPLGAQHLPPLLLEPRLDEGELVRRIELPDEYLGHGMLCLGAEPPWAVSCEDLDLLPGEGRPMAPATGLALTGTYFQGGRPIVGARVAVVPAGLETLRPFHLPLGPGEGGLRRQVETDATGRFELPPLAAGDILLEVVLPTGRVLHSEAIRLPEAPTVGAPAGPGSWPALDLGAIEVGEGLAVEIVVVDAEDRPVAGARVGGRQGIGPEDLLSFAATTGAEGRARLAGFRLEGEVVLRCEAEGFLPLEERHELVPVEHVCRLLRPALVDGRIESLSGPPPVGAEVELLAPGEDLEPPPVPVAADGGFRIGGLRPGEYLLRASAPGHERVERSFYLRAGEALRLETLYLPRGRVVRGRVVDARSGTPVAGARLRAPPPSEEVLAESDAEGGLAFVLPEERRSRLRLGAVGYAELELELGAPDDRDEELLFELLPGGAVLATVLGAEGRPCLGCRVRIEPRGGRLTTDERGEALSETLAPGIYKVWVSRLTHRGSVVIEEPLAESRQVRLEADRLSRVDFRLGRPPLVLRLAPPAEAAWVLAARSGTHQQQRRRESDGSYRFARPESPETPLHLELLYLDPLSGTEARVRIASLRLEGGEESLEVELPPTLIRGRVLRGGRPLAGAEVRLRALADASTCAVVRSAADGRFRVPHLARGFYSLSIDGRPVKTVVARAGRPVDLGTFRLFEGTP